MATITLRPSNWQQPTIRKRPFAAGIKNGCYWVGSGRACRFRKESVDAAAPVWKTEWPLWEIEGSKLPRI